MKTQSKFTFCKGLLGAASILLLHSLVWGQSSSRSQNATDSPPAEVASASAAPSVAASTVVGKPHDEAFVIGSDDILAISVWKEPDVSRVVPVRSDGKISLPLVGEVQATGRTPRQLEVEIAGKLQSYISEPDVTVIVQEVRSQRFNILGQISRPGSYALTNSMTILDAIAMAGGFRDFAKQKAIYVLRAQADGTQQRIGFNYKEMIKGKNPDQNIKLTPRDTIVVP
jgi:polysaccharide export outer membrane protein